MAFAHNGGVRLYWREDGDPQRPALLLLHAVGTDLALWDRAIPYLTPRFRVLRFDMRGHGASDAPAGDYRMDVLAQDALAVLDSAHAARVSVCGISLGGMVALELTLQASARVNAMVCACSSAQMDPEIWEARLQSIRAGGMAAVADAAIERFFSEPFRRNHPEQVASVRTALLATPPQGYMGCGAAIRDMDLIERIGAIRTPTLVLSGTLDIATPFETHGARIAAAIPAAQHASLRAAHLPCIETPGTFAAAAREFIAQLGAGDTMSAARERSFEAGLQVRRTVLGEQWVERALRERTAFNTDYQSLITRYAWQEIWGRPGLDQRTRRLLVIAMTVALGRWEEFRLHVRAGLQQGGFTEDELQETLLQSAIYAGVPAANTAFTEANAIITELFPR